MWIYSVTLSASMYFYHEYISVYVPKISQLYYSIPGQSMSQSGILQQIVEYLTDVNWTRIHMKTFQVQSQMLPVLVPV